jgi:hypothetical protein
MPGTRAQAKNIVDTATGYSNAAVTAGQILIEYVVICFGRLSGIKFSAATAGGGACVADVLLNGTTIWANVANKPTLASGTGEFTNSVPDAGMRGVRPGDRLTLQVNTITTTGPARLCATVGIEGNA